MEEKEISGNNGFDPREHIVLDEDLFDLWDRLGTGKGEESRIIPVLLIKPGTVQRLNRHYYISDLLDYFDRRTGDVGFYVPGYTYASGRGILKLLGNDPSVKVKLQRVGTILGTNEDFIDFINEFEKRGYKYYGRTELLFIKYYSGAPRDVKEWEFDLLKRYDLTALYLAARLQGIEDFLEYIVGSFSDYETDFLDRADHIYNTIMEQKHL